MRRTRLKILPSKCLGTLGFALLLLACPTTAEESVRPADMSEAEPLAAHVHARIKSAPPDGLEVCKIGEMDPGPITASQTREAMQDHVSATDHNQHPRINLGKEPISGIPCNEEVITVTGMCETTNRMLINERYSKHRRTPIQADKSNAKNNIGSTSRSEETTNILTREHSRDNRASDKISSRISSPHGVRSSVRDDSRRSKWNSFESRIIKKMEISVSPSYRIDDRESRYRDSLSRTENRGALRKITIRENLENRRLNTQSKTQLIARRARDTTRESRRHADLGRSGEFRAVREEKSLIQVISRRSEKQADERRFRNSADVHDEFRRSVPYAIDSKGIGRMEQSKPTSYNRHERHLGVRQSISRNVIRVVSSRTAERDFPENRRLNIRSQPQLLSRRTRDDSRDSRRNTDYSRIRDDRTLQEWHSEIRDATRRSGEFVADRRVESSLRMNELLSRRFREISPKYTATGKMTRRTRSLPEIRTVIRDASRRSQWNSRDSRKMERIERTDIPSFRREERESRIRYSMSKTTDRVVAIGMMEGGVPEDRRLSIRSKAQLLSRRARDTSLESKSHSHVIRSRESRAVAEGNSKLQDTTRRSARLTAERRFRSNARLDERVERQLRESKHDYSERTTKRASSLPETRSDNREASRRSARYSTDSRRMERLERPDNPSYKQDERESRNAVLSSRTLDRVASLRMPEMYSVESYGLQSRAQPPRLSRREREASRVIRRYAVLGHRVESDTFTERFSEKRHSTRKIEWLAAEGKFRSTSPHNEIAARKLGEDGYDYAERTTRRASSFPEFRSDNRVASRRSVRYSTDLRRMERLERSDRPNYRRDERELRMSVSLSRYANRVEPSRITEKDIPENRRLHTTFKPALLSRRARDTTRESRSTDDSLISRDIKFEKQRYSEAQGIARRLDALTAVRRAVIASRFDISERQIRMYADLRRRGDISSLSERYSGKRHTARKVEGLVDERKFQNTSPINEMVGRQSRKDGNDYTERATRRSRSLPGTRSDVRDISRRSALNPTDSFKMEHLERSQSPYYRQDERESRISVFISRNAERVAALRTRDRNTPENRRLSISSEPHLHSRRARDTRLESKSHSDVIRSRESRAVAEGSSKLQDMSRRSERLTTERRFRSNARRDEIVGRQLRQSKHDYAEKSTRRASSLPGTRSDISEASRRSARYSTDSRRMERMERSDSPSYKRDERESRSSVPASSTPVRMASLRIEVRELPERHRLITVSNPQLLSRRARDASKETRGYAVLGRRGEIDTMSERYSEKRHSTTKIERLAAARRFRSTSPLNEVVRRQLQKDGYAYAERTSKGTYSLQGRNSDDHDAYHRYARFLTNSDWLDRMVNSGIPIYNMNERHLGVRQSISSNAIRVVSSRTAERDFPENRRLNIRSQPQLLSRRTRDDSRDSRRNTDYSRIRDDRTLQEWHSEIRDATRRSREFVADRRVENSLRMNELLSRRFREISPKYIATGKMTRRTRSLPEIRTVIRDASRRSQWNSRDSRKMERIERTDIPSFRREERESRIRSSMSKTTDRVVAIGMMERGVPEDRRLSIRSKAQLLSRRARDTSLESKSHSDVIRSRESRAVAEGNSKLQDTTRRSARLTAERRFRSNARLDERVERQLRESKHDYSERTTKRASSLPETRSDNREASRRSARYSTDSRRMERLERPDNPSYKQDEREFRNTVYVSRNAYGVSPSRIMESEFHENQRWSSRSKQTLPSRLRVDPFRGARVYSVNSRAREDRTLTFRYYNNREMSRRSPLSATERRLLSIARLEKTAERRLRSKGSDFTDMITRKTGHLPGVRNIISDSSRREVINARRMDRVEQYAHSRSRLPELASRNVVTVSSIEGRSTQKLSTAIESAESRRMNHRFAHFSVRKAQYSRRESIRVAGASSRRVNIFGSMPERLYGSNFPHFRVPHPSTFRIESAVPIHWGLENDSDYFSSGHKVNQGTSYPAKSSMVFHEVTKSVDSAQCPALVSSDRLLRTSELTSGIRKFTVPVNMSSHIPGMQNAPEDEWNTNSLSVWKFIAIIFSKVFPLTKNGFGSISLGNLVTEPFKATVFALWSSATPEVYSTGEKVFEGFTSPNSMTYDNIGYQEITVKNPENAKECLPGGVIDENLFDMLHPKMANKDKLFSMTIGGCIAALTISVATK